MDGSSPRVWGTLLLWRLLWRLFRFIPTGVGNTAKADVSNTDITVHPHGCGEHAECVFAPLMNLRFIPTGVGNTENGNVTVWSMAVHPHGCGEHAIHAAMAKVNAGSSPRVWGTRQASTLDRTTNRFIPTGVGNTG